MADVYTFAYDGDSRDIIPYNLDDLEIKERLIEDNAAWHYVKEVDIIQVSRINAGSDYDWLYNVVKTNRCDKVNVHIYCDGHLHYTGRFNYYTCGFNDDTCTIDIRPVADTLYTDLMAVIEDERDVMSLVPDETITLLGAGIAYTDAKRLNDVINAFISDVGLTLQSSFLQDLVSPAPFNYPAGTFQSPFAWYSTNVNPFEKLYLTLPNAQTERNMTMSLSELLIKLSKSLPVRWCVDEANAKLIVEHVHYFENGRSYTGPAGVTIDITAISGGRWLTGTGKTMFTQTVFPITENRRPKYGGYNANYGVLLVNECVMDGADHQQLRPEFECDPELIEAEGVDCVMLLSCYVNLGNLLIYEHNISGTIINNFPLSEWIQIEYWLYDRYFDRVYSPINTVLWWSTKSRRALRKQDTVTAPSCCDPLNPYLRVRTQYGDGYIMDYSFRPHTGMAKLNLKYADL